MIALFDKDDELMLRAKTGNWWAENPQRAMANNSILISEKDQMSYKELKEKLSVIRQFGEPGFVFVKNYEYVVNPCAEIVMRPQINDESGFAFCNLVEINAEKIKVTGKKETDKKYYRHSGYPGGLKVASFKELMEKNPIAAMKRAFATHVPKPMPYDTATYSPIFPIL
jgi:hypothetical protein